MLCMLSSAQTLTGAVVQSHIRTNVYKTMSKWLIEWTIGRKSGYIGKRDRLVNWEYFKFTLLLALMTESTQTMLLPVKAYIK